jgi:hypothetical protein
MADFSALKERVSIEQAAQNLGLQLKNTGAQLRGPCPACKSGGERALAITPSKQLFYCFSAGIGGDLITLVGHIKKCSLHDAGRHISDAFGVGNSGTRAPVHSTTSSPSPPRQKPAFDAEAYAQKLDPAHEALAVLELSADTLREFKSGYSASGVNRGKLAIALHDRHGAIVGFAGYADGQLTFPQGFDHRLFVFNAHRATGEVRIVRDVVQVMRAHEVDEVAVCFLTDLVDAEQDTFMAALKDERGFKTFF